MKRQDTPDAARHPDPLHLFADEAHARVAAGYYDAKALAAACPPKTPPSLKAAMLAPRGTFPVIAEVKPASPTAGEMRGDVDAAALARAFMDAGARGVSVLAEDARFGGSLDHVIAAAGTGAPVLFKDFVVDPAQLKAARRAGASAVLLILDVHQRGLATGDVHAFVKQAHALGLEVLLECYDATGLKRAMDTDADMVGVNNRDLRARGLPVDRSATARALANVPTDRPVIALSGVKERADVEAAFTAGASGVLVGSVLMQAKDPAERLRELAC